MHHRHRLVRHTTLQCLTITYYNCYYYYDYYYTPRIYYNFRLFNCEKLTL